MLKNTINHLLEKNTKTVKQLKMITYQPNTFENPSIVNIESVIINHPKISHKSWKIISPTEKVGSNSSLYCDPRKWEF